MKDIVYFESRAVKTAGGCWEWRLSLQWTGYGMYRDGEKTLRAHRGAWEAAHGPIPAGQWVLHKCDNRKCVNPDHLFLGDRTANTSDMVAKRRQAVGSRHGHSKLTEADVSIIKWCLDAGVVQARLAALYGVDAAVMSRIKTGAAWTHVGPLRYSS